MLALGIIAFGLAALVAAMTFANVAALRQPPLPMEPPSLAILIPARNEEDTIGDCIDAALASVGTDFEIIVLDDHSTDRTAERVRSRAARDPRIRVEAAPPLPAGWNGKQHACHVLSRLTDRPLLLFIDADVRLAPEGAARLAGMLQQDGVDLVSGVPRQVMGSFLETLLVPMINCLILSFLPIARMRVDKREALAAGCGQLMAVRRVSYAKCGGHSAIRTSLHDGLKLPRLFRKHGLRTDLVEGTNLAQCRMYATGADLIAGLLKNATEGIATARLLPIWSVLLLATFVLPCGLLILVLATSQTSSAALAGAACALLFAARYVQVRKSAEPPLAAILTPASVLVFVSLQWLALARRALGIQNVWRGRAYTAQG